MGKGLDYGLSPKQNVFSGRYGAETGFVMEFGRMFYIKNRNTKEPINYGLDWTLLSLNYNRMDEWIDYALESGGESKNATDTRIAVAVSTKIGPMISFNPIEKVVLDARIQIVPIIRFFDLIYHQNSGQADDRYFTFANYSREQVDKSFDAEDVKNRMAYGIETSFGITLRRKSIGLAIDYIKGDVKTNYNAYDTGVGATAGKEKISTPNMQLKLSITL
ncbi:hypothetical protein ADIARSV_2708 [Arcticibacter svalbardensis MN12-7]|uniref:Outer membrane protein beta-barrel domain-containing protein n=1 Tax=Arcticibacter svalbardensis MN12-7 TaxID=1150600 RepID=R9GRD1_9SPHI|nr:hypothetical protein ADIARSV_2708 [Arcticibacter svalbardensis MN12-7]